MACETAAAALAAEYLDFARVAVAELVRPAFPMRAWRREAAFWNGYLAIDAKTVFDALEHDTLVSDRRAALDLCALKETVRDPASASFVRW
eukprot:12354416-Alexandrium_andersonii.AAC.1